MEIHFPPLSLACIDNLCLNQTFFGIYPLYLPTTVDVVVVCLEYSPPTSFRSKISFQIMYGCGVFRGGIFTESVFVAARWLVFPKGVCMGILGICYDVNEGVAKREGWDLSICFGFGNISLGWSLTRSSQRGHLTIISHLAAERKHVSLGELSLQWAHELMICLAPHDFNKL